MQGDTHREKPKSSKQCTYGLKKSPGVMKYLYCLEILYSQYKYFKIFGPPSPYISKYLYWESPGMVWHKWAVSKDSKIQENKQNVKFQQKF